MPDDQFDVLDISDLRFPGGTSHSIAEEISAQHKAGLKTGLLHLNGPLVARTTPVNPLIARHIRQGHATLLVDAQPVRARLTVIRHPAVLQYAADQLPPIVTERVVVVANAGPLDIDGRQHYDPQVVDELAQKHFGQLPLWAPIGPLVREAIPDLASERVLQDDWVNIIDVDAWEATRSQWRSDRPVVGRHSRPSPQKWPADPATLRAVYPVDGSWQVRVLGGADPVAKVLGEIPEGWEVLPFGAISPAEFLVSLDFFVYYHDENWVEAFGRTILEAIASGAVAVLPPHFRALFGEAAFYAEPAEVRVVVESLRADRPRYDEQVQTAREVARKRFGHEAHVGRLGELLGDDSPAQTLATPGHPQVARQDEIPPRQHLPDVRPGRRSNVNKPRVLLMSSNGAGMGHLTRLLSYAERMQDQADVHFLSLSQAVPVVGQMGYSYEYLPSSGALNMPPRLWSRLYVERVVETMDRFRPDVVVFDGTWPYTGTLEIREAHPDTKWIWSRRGMWRPGVNSAQVEKENWFDAVLEPGDFAASYDHGATASADAHRVGAVTLLDPADLGSRTDARAALGLPAHARLGLVSLGLGTINDTRSDAGAAVEALRLLGVEICVTQPESGRDQDRVDDLHVVRHYPLSRHYAAFDVVISATGYNSFHELLRFGVPALFVPNAATALDDQEARARYAQDQGWAFHLPSLTVPDARDRLETLLDQGAAMASRAQAADPGNGAAAAAALILELAGVEVAS